MKSKNIINFFLKVGASLAVCTILITSLFSFALANHEDNKYKMDNHIPCGVYDGNRFFPDEETYSASDMSRSLSVDGEPELLWRFPTDRKVHSIPAIDNNNTIYFGGYRQLYALYPNGTLKWSFPTEGWVTSSPVIGNDGTIYFGGGAEQPPRFPPYGGNGILSGDNYLYAVNPDGSLQWKFLCGGSIDYSSPVIGKDGTIYAVTGVSIAQCHRVVAINPNNGTLKWEYRVGKACYAAPVVGKDGTVYVPTPTEEGLLALDPNDGRLKWNFSEGHWETVNAPSIAEDGTIIFLSTKGIVHALTPEGDLKWEFPICTTSFYSTPVIAEDGSIYICTMDFWRLYALNPDGTWKWSYPLERCSCFTPVIGDDGIIYFAEYGKRFHAVRDDGHQATPVWSYPINGYVTGGATLKNGVLYFGSYDGNLTALKVSSQNIAKGPWTKYQKDIKNTGSEEILHVNANGRYEGLINSPVHFSGSASGGSLSYSWHWDFGDGNISDEQNPEHIYTHSGIYTVTFTVTDNENHIEKDHTQATITETRMSPTVKIVRPETALYLKNKRLRPFSFPLIIGDITVVVDAFDNESEIERVEFYIDDMLKATDIEPLFNWLWIERTGLKPKHIIKVVAYDKAGNSANDEITVQKFGSHMVNDADEGTDLEIIDVTGGLGLHVFIKNTGPVDATNVKWGLLLPSGRRIIIPKERPYDSAAFADGIIPVIKAGSTIRVTIPIVGIKEQFEITVRVSGSRANDYVRYGANVFGPIVYRIKGPFSTTWDD